ncbi:hypothetical protein GJ689_24545 [Rhodoplanes serenus]|uniref:Uncharacterized protein n=1 Tax=Rhodoplanes serenus TaxID=200615 RepID=A0A9X4XQC8_9BRAD|nr:hypothetical protein [Rhodoplanes serenus]MTW19365.1 hypothetical protein [Rhodoplanes serenus]
MDPIGKVAATALRRSPPTTPPALPAAADGGTPALVDLVTDYELPRLFSAVSITGQPRPLVRALGADERSRLERRAAELRTGLGAFGAGDADAVRAALSAMLTGYRSMRQQGDEAHATVAIMARVLAEFPRWAIQRACLMVARGEAGLDRRWPPNDAEMHAIVARVVEPYRDTLARVAAMLAAPVEPPSARRLSRPRETVETRRGHVARVMADMDARRAARDEAAAPGV